MKFEIKIRLTHTEVREFESAGLAHAYAAGRIEKSQAHFATLQSIIQVDPPFVDRPCPGCQPVNTAPLLKLPAPLHDDDGREIEVDFGKLAAGP